MCALPSPEILQAGAVKGLIKRKKKGKDVTCVEHLSLLNSKGFRFKAFYYMFILTYIIIHNNVIIL